MSWEGGDCARQLAFRCKWLFWCINSPPAPGVIRVVRRIHKSGTRERDERSTFGRKVLFGVRSNGCPPQIREWEETRKRHKQQPETKTGGTRHYEDISTKVRYRYKAYRSTVCIIPSLPPWCGHESTKTCKIQNISYCNLSRAKSKFDNDEVSVSCK